MMINTWKIFAPVACVSPTNGIYMYINSIRIPPGLNRGFLSFFQFFLNKYLSLFLSPQLQICFKIKNKPYISTVPPWNPVTVHPFSRLVSRTVNLTHTVLSPPVINWNLPFSVQTCRTKCVKFGLWYAIVDIKSPMEFI